MALDSWWAGAWRAPTHQRRPKRRPVCEMPRTSHARCAMPALDVQAPGQAGAAAAARPEGQAPSPPAGAGGQPAGAVAGEVQPAQPRLPGRCGAAHAPDLAQPGRWGQQQQLMPAPPRNRAAVFVCRRMICSTASAALVCGAAACSAALVNGAVPRTTDCSACGLGCAVIVQERAFNPPWVTSSRR